MTSPTAQAAFPFTAPRSSGESGGARSPVHVTLHLADGGWDLHAPRAEAALRAAFSATRSQPGFHAFHFSVRRDGVHLLVEADSSGALVEGVRAFTFHATRALNRAHGRIGPVFGVDYSVQALRTSAEFRQALRFLIGPERGPGAA